MTAQLKIKLNDVYIKALGSTCRRKVCLSQILRFNELELKHARFPLRRVDERVETLKEMNFQSIGEFADLT